MDSSLSDLRRVVAGVCQDLDTPLALSVFLMAKYGEWDQLARKAVDPGTYVCPEKFGRDAAAVGLLKKFDSLPLSLNTAQTARDAWFSAEKQCFGTNRRLSGYVDELVYGLSSPASAHNDPVIMRGLRMTRQIIHEIVGEAPNLINGRFGPGATLSDSAAQCTVPHKLSSDPTLTAGAVWYLPQVLDSAWGRAMASRQTSFCVQNYNTHQTVPKNALTDRSIAVEPSINGYLQLGAGRVLRQRLRRFGLDLDTAGQNHAQLARIAARDRTLATRDLSNASDTVARELVTLLLPMSWVQLLEDLRAPVTRVKDGRLASRQKRGAGLYLEKFSSMGNGYTFELETLIFLGITLTAMRLKDLPAVLGHNVSVFGDDIILPEESVTLTDLILSFCGFSVNTSKSFSGGSPFRESCGSDWFANLPVRPFFIKKSARLNTPAGWISVANGLRALYDRLGVTTNRGWIRALEQLPSNIRRLRGPSYLGDLVVHDDDQGRWLIRKRNCIAYIRVWRPSLTRSSYVSLRRFDADVTLACALYGVQLPRVSPLAKQIYGVVSRDPEMHFKEGWSPILI